MCPAPHDPLQLLRQLEARKLVTRASELLPREPAAAPPAAAAPPTAPPARNGAPGGLRRFYPAAVPVGSAGLCHRLRTSVLIDGRPTRQGFRCPLVPPEEAAGSGAYHGAGLPTPAELAALTGEPEWAELALEEIAFIDTETTGLAGGSGTYAFLVGVGRLVAEPLAPGGYVFQLDQWFIEDFAGEAAQLEALEEVFASARAIVSYNGAGFDVPLLETRWRMNRRRPPLPALHLDLLRYARRLWRGKLESRSLGSVEREILGIGRTGDVPGAWVPRIYFEYLQGHGAERIIGVLDHHAQDIISLAALLGLMAHAWRAPQAPCFSHPAEQWGLSRLYALRGLADRALCCLENAVLAARDEDQGFRLSLHLARSYRRAGRLEDALAIWEARRRQCDAARPERLEVLVELAKHAEHTLRQPASALAFVEEALGWLDRGLYPPPPATLKLRAGLDRRRARLVTRLARR